MNRIILLTTLILLPYLFFANNKLSLSGTWYNPFRDMTIQIVDYPDGIKVRGLHSGFRWVYFDMTGSYTFRDVYGNKIKRIDRGHIIYSARNRNERLTFVNMDDFHIQNDRKLRKYRYYEDYIDSNQQYDRNDNDANYLQEYNYQSENRNQKAFFADPEGTWKVKEISKNVFIVETRDGIKARFSDESRWYSYTKDLADPFLFKNEKGHTYRLSDDGQLIWNDKENKRRFYLIKISDEMLE